MVIDLTQFPQYAEATKKMANRLAQGVTVEEQTTLFAETFEILGNELSSMTEEQLRSMFDDRAKNADLTNSEYKFFNSIEKNVGTKNPILLPEETIEQVFDDLTVEHPLLSVINFRNSSLRLKAVTAETAGLAKWGQIHGEIQGQLNQAFKETEFSQFKLTAFVVVPKDAEKFGPKWLKTFITTQIKEAISVALEQAIVSGDGLLKPVGLMKDLSKATVDSSTGSDIVTYKTDKADLADLSDMTPNNAVEKLAPVMTFLSYKEVTNSLTSQTEKIPRNIDGKVRMIVNPIDKYTLEAKFTSINLNGLYTTNLPYGISLISSLAVPEGKAVVFVSDRYDGFMASASSIEQYNQTFAMEDLDLYLTKSYFYGIAKDNNSAAVVSLVKAKGK